MQHRVREASQLGRDTKTYDRLPAWSASDAKSRLPSKDDDRRVRLVKSKDVMTYDGELPRHPPPQSTESLLPYLLRLADENGFSTPCSVLTRCGIKAAELGGQAIAIEGLARAACQSVEELKRIAYRHTSGSPKVYLLEHELIAKDLRLGSPRVCPECVRENGFIAAHFDLKVMIACPTHEKLLISSCPACFRPLSWRRPRLLECNCGASLDCYKRPKVAHTCIDLLDLVKRKVLRLPVPEGYSSGIPATQLGELSLRSVLYLVGALGWRRLRGSCRAEKFDEIVPLAATVLSEWPVNFYKLLKEAAGYKSSDAPIYLTQDLKDIYWCLRIGLKPCKETEFIYAELSRFSMDHCGTGCRAKTVQSRSGNNSERYLPLKLVAKRMGIDRRTAKSVIAKEGVSTITIPSRRGERVLVAVTAVGYPQKSPGKVFRLPEAAKLIGVTPGVLKVLKSNGDYETKNLPRQMNGYHELDVAAFAAKLRSLLPRKSHTISPAKSIRFDRILKHSQIACVTKASIVRKMLKREIVAIGCEDMSIQGLLFSREQFAAVRNGNDCVEMNASSSRPTRSRAGWKVDAVQLESAPDAAESGTAHPFVGQDRRQDHVGIEW
jgi:hypothetical protein